ncbi:MAG: hypothetical protein KatS3mg110_3012 [Pirellulaceae bacterium]|nr:MAG: hypothetical protein KatS3mg110_3012 [Pirellulaceae bacterium]
MVPGAVPQAHAFGHLGKWQAIGMFFEWAIRIVAEDKIQAAMRDGQFDGLPGFGKPCPLIDEPYDEYWWIRRKIIREELQALLADARHKENSYGKPAPE